MGVLTLSWAVYGVTVLLSILIASYLYMTRNFNYWKKRDILEFPPTPFVGNFLDCLLFRTPIPVFLGSLYERGKGLPYVGFYLFDKPVLVLRDPEIIKNVLVKDFDHFTNRYSTATESDVVGSSNLFFARPPIWRSLRTKLTPVFTSGKMKGMFPLVKAVCEDLNDHFESLDLKGDGRVLELKEISAKYTTDVIASCVFGLQVNSLNNPDAEFRRYGRKIFELSFKRGVELLSLFFIPGIVKPLGFKTFEASTTEFMRKMFWDILNERLRSGQRRNDLIDLLIDLKNSQTDHDDPNAFHFDGDHLVAQAAVFFAAGFETSSAMMSFTLHELSMQPDIQTKLREEITTAMQKSGGKLTYDMVHELPYLAKIGWETLRKYPSVPFLDRLTARDYKISKTGLVVEKGTPVYVPLLGLHYDPEYYPDPDKYDPERFTEENKQERRSHVYLPFGDGPRNCIGLRFGLMQAKLGIIEIISNYELSPCEKTLNPMRLDPKAFILVPEGGLYHRVRKLETNLG